MKRLPPFPKVEATPVQVAAVKKRILDAAAKAGASNGIDFAVQFPRFHPAVDALPDFEPLLMLAQEFRPMFLHAFVQVGVLVPREVWDRLGVGWLYEEPET